MLRIILPKKMFGVTGREIHIVSDRPCQFIETSLGRCGIYLGWAYWTEREGQLDEVTCADCLRVEG